MREERIWVHSDFHDRYDPYLGGVVRRPIVPPEKARILLRWDALVPEESYWRGILIHDVLNGDPHAFRILQRDRWAAIALFQRAGLPPPETVRPAAWHPDGDWWVAKGVGHGEQSVALIRDRLPEAPIVLVQRYLPGPVERIQVVGSRVFRYHLESDDWRSNVDTRAIIEVAPLVADADWIAALWRYSRLRFWAVDLVRVGIVPYPIDFNVSPGLFCQEDDWNVSLTAADWAKIITNEPGAITDSSRDREMSGRHVPE